MAVSAPSFVQPLANDRTNVGKVVVVDITLDSSYADDGESFDPTTLGFSEVWYANIVQKAPVGTAAGLYVFQWDYTNKKIVAYWVDTSVDGAALAEVTAATDLSAVTVRAFFYGLPA